MSWPQPSNRSPDQEGLAGLDPLVVGHHRVLPPERTDTHRRGWGTIAVQLGDAIAKRGG
jgi:hypothetical protein